MRIRRASTVRRSQVAANTYWGAWIGSHITGTEAPFDANAITGFASDAGKTLSIVNWSSPFYNSGSSSYYTFQPSEFNTIRNYGAIPMFSWGPNPGGTAAGGMTPANIAAGTQDTYITTWATAAKNWGHPFFLRFAWEMNASWFSWGVGNNGNTAADYIAMWQHIYGIFQSVGATNATWIWCPNIATPATLSALGDTYPGDAYVDWLGLDGYNFNSPWQSFYDVIKPSYNQLVNVIAPSKPVMICETGALESGSLKPQWYTEMFSTLPVAFPKIRALTMFDVIDTTVTPNYNWPIESTTNAQTAFAAGIASSRYKTNTYATLDGLVRVGVTGTQTSKTAYDTVIDADSPLSHWKMDEPTGSAQITDRVGVNSLPLITSGGVTYRQTAIVNGNSSDASITFNGTSGVFRDSGNTWSVNSSGFTVEAWIKPAAIGSVMTIFEKSNATGNSEQYGASVLADGTMQFFLRETSSTYRIVTGGSALVANTAYLISFVWTGTVIRGYVNGVQIGTDVAATRYAVNDGSPFQFGASGNVNWFNGIIDEAAWFPAALTQSRILAHYTAGS